MQPRRLYLDPRLPNLEPEWGQDLPIWSQNGAQGFQLGAKMPFRLSECDPRSPQNVQLGTKMAPKAFNWEPRWPPTFKLGAKITHKTANLEQK